MKKQIAFLILAAFSATACRAPETRIILKGENEAKRLRQELRQQKKVNIVQLAIIRDLIEIVEDLKKRRGEKKAKRKVDLSYDDDKIAEELQAMEAALSHALQAVLSGALFYNEDREGRKLPEPGPSDEAVADKDGGSSEAPESIEFVYVVCGDGSYCETDDSENGPWFCGSMEDGKAVEVEALPDTCSLDEVFAAPKLQTVEQLNAAVETLTERVWALEAKVSGEEAHAESGGADEDAEIAAELADKLHKAFGASEGAPVEEGAMGEALAADEGGAEGAVVGEDGDGASEGAVVAGGPLEDATDAAGANDSAKGAKTSAAGQTSGAVEEDTSGGGAENGAEGAGEDAGADGETVTVAADEGGAEGAVTTVADDKTGEAVTDAAGGEAAADTGSENSDVSGN